MPGNRKCVSFNILPDPDCVYGTGHQHSGEIGKIAAETFLKRIDQENWKPKLNKNILKSELIIRNSSNKKSSVKST